MKYFIAFVLSFVVFGISNAANYTCSGPDEQCVITEVSNAQYGTKRLMGVYAEPTCGNGAGEFTGGFTTVTIY